LLGSAELLEIEQALSALKAVSLADDTAAIKAAIDKTNHITDEFAARRMDNSIRQALQGHKVDEV